MTDNCETVYCKYQAIWLCYVACLLLVWSATPIVQLVLVCSFVLCFVVNLSAPVSYVMLAVLRNDTVRTSYRPFESDYIEYFDG